MPLSQQDILSRLTNARVDSGGSATADCPLCEQEGSDKGRGKLKVFADGSIVCYRFHGTGRDEHRKHIAEIYKLLNLDKPEIYAFITQTILGGKVTLDIDPAERNKQRVVARNCHEVLHRDVIRLDLAKDRNMFVRSLTSLDDIERKKVEHALVQLADRFSSAQAATDTIQQESTIKYVGFAALDDGTLIEQIGSGFAIYYPKAGATEIAPEITFEGITYKPCNDAAGVLGLANRLEEYYTEEQLDSEIEAYIYRHVDISDRDRKFAAKYIRLSYIADRLLEINYLRPLGRPGNGKSRYVRVVGGPCYKALIVTSPSAASIYRLIDRHHCTLAIDEANYIEGSEDTTELIRILNSGYQRGNPIPRVERGLDGEFIVRIYDAFGPKLIASLETSKSFAFESRCIQAEMEETTRNDIKLRYSQALLDDQERLRAQLTLWRLRNWSRDYEQLLDQAESELRKYKIKARFVQIGIPLYSLIGDTNSRAEFARMLEDRTTRDAEDRSESLDGQIVIAIHELLFVVQQADEEGALQKITIRMEDGIPEPEDGKSCELVLIDNITERINDGRPQTKLVDKGWIGKCLRKLGLKSEKIKKGLNRDKRALIFNGQALAKLFSQFSLPVPTDFAVPPVPNRESDNDTNDLGMGQENQTAPQSDFAVPHSTVSESISYMNWDGWDRRIPETEGKILQEASEWPELPGLFDAWRYRVATTVVGGQGHPILLEQDRDEVVQGGERALPVRYVDLTTDPVTVGPPSYAQADAVIYNPEDRWWEGRRFQYQAGAERGGAGIVALDTETEPFDPKRGITHRNARMIGLAICYDGSQAHYETIPDAWPLLVPEPEQTVIFHNAMFDLGVLERAGLPLPKNWEDTLIAAQLLDENDDHGLKELARAHLGISDPLTFDEADRMRLFDPEVFKEYARNDSRYTYLLWERFKQQLEDQGLMRVYGLEKALVPVTMEMERAGMKIDLSLLGTLNAEVRVEIERVRAEIFDLAGSQFDLNSPVKVAAILYDKLGVPCKGKTDGGNRSVDREALSEVRGYHPVVDAILRHREIDRLASTFLGVLSGMVDESGRIHPEFKPLGSKGGRFSCSDPNVQQIPVRSQLGRRLRRAFIAEEGYQLVVADYSQMELRVLAHFSRDRDLIASYTSDQEIDLHTLTASKMFKRDLSEVSGEERKVAKMINFGIAYGITPQGLFNRLRPEGVEVTEDQCERFIEDYFKTYRGVRAFLDLVASTIRGRGYVRSLFGRRRRLTGKTARERRQAQNFIVQASAADIAKDAMIKLHRALPETARLIAQIHDEFIVECRESDAERVRELMIEVMSEIPAGFTIPLKVDAHIGDSWGDAKG